MTSTTDPNTVTYIQQLQQQLVATQQQLQQLTIDTQNEFKQYSLNAANHNNNTNTKHILKPTKPPTFHGDRRTNAEVWLLELQNYFSVTGVTDGAQRIAFAVSQFRDNAVIWWKHTITEEQDTEILSDWNKFTKILLQNYAPVEAAESARVALHRLKQIGTVANYCDTFLRHLNNINDMSVADQLFTFKNGLQSYIAKEVHQQHPTTLAEAMTYATRAELESRMYNRTEPRRGNFRPPHRYPHHVPGNYSRFNSGGGHGNNAVTPMELGNINGSTNESYNGDYYNERYDYDNASNHERNYYNEDVNTNPQHMINNINGKYNPSRFPSRNGNGNFRVPGLTREQIQNYRSTNSCFKCGQVGHFKNSCPKK